MRTAEADDRRRRRVRRARAGSRTIAGYSVSMVLLALVSLTAIPAMIAASGAAAWGIIAVGQSIGGVAAVIIAYGWGLSGPAVIARSDDVGRKSEYAESVVAKLAIAVPIGALAFGLASLLGGEYSLFAGLGALSMASVGLTANWYFIGLAQPYRLLACETLPRVLGTGIGILLMYSGSSAAVGVLFQLAGMVAASLTSTIVILKPWRIGDLRAIQRRSVGAVLGRQRSGITSSVLSSFYSAVPIVIVALIAPAAQPVYAVVEKVQRQVIVGLGPFVTVMQGWVPRAPGPGLPRRIRQSIVVSAIGSACLGAFMLAIAPQLIGWLGSGEITPPFITLVLMAVITGVSLFESVTSKACLAALGRLDLVARSTAVGTFVGLPLVALGALFWNASGALAGILTGLILRLVMELHGIRRVLRTTEEAASRSPAESPFGTDG